MRRDPKENDPRYSKIIDSARQEAEKDLPQTFSRGHCFLIWKRQKEILMDKYGIDWKSPTEMNPDIWFD